MPFDSNRFRRAAPPTFTITYVGSPPTAFRTAAEYALGLIDSWFVLSATAPVRIRATWENLTATVDPSVLGATNSNWVVKAPYSNNIPFGALRPLSSHSPVCSALCGHYQHLRWKYVSPVRVYLAIQ